MDNLIPKASVVATGQPVELNGAHAEENACRVSIDWLEASVKDGNELRMHQIVKEWLGSAYDLSCWEVKKNDEKGYRAEGVDGVQVETDRRGSKNRYGVKEPWTAIRIPGTACQNIGTERVLGLTMTLHESGTMNVARIDAAGDDYAYSFLPRDFGVHAVGPDLSDEIAVFLPGVVTRVRGKNWDWSRKDGGCLWIGKGGSERLLRVYDKGVRSKGAIPACRVELQMRDKAAMHFVRQLMEPGGRSNLAAIYAQHLVGFIDFRVPQDGGSRAATQDWPRQAWWQAFVGDAQKAPPLVVDRTSVEQWSESLARQCRGFLEVQLQHRGMSLNLLDRLDTCDPSACVAAAAVLSVIRGAQPIELSPHQLARLAQLNDMKR